MSFPNHPECTECLLYQEARNVGLPTIWKENSLPPAHQNPALLFIGQNPGTHEDRTGSPFVGRSGEMLHQIWIESLGLHELATIYITNSVRCGPRSVNEAKYHRVCFPLHTVPDLNTILKLHDRVGIVCVSAPAASELWKQLTGEKVNQKASFARNATTIRISPCHETYVPQTMNMPTPTLMAVGTESPTSATNSETPSKTVSKSVSTSLPERQYPPKSSSTGSNKTTQPKTQGVGGRELTLFSTYHPAAVMRKRSLIHGVDGHMSIVKSWLTNDLPTPTVPDLIPPRNPQ